jgi:hypothetical protein
MKYHSKFKFRSRLTFYAGLLAIPLLAAMLLVALMPNAKAEAFTPPRTAVLGDSHASGEGGGAYLPGTDTATNRCRRSPNSWAGQLSSMGLIKLDTFSACAGAKIDNVLTTGQYNEPAQIDTIPANTEVVYLQVGGNDTGQSQLVGLCLQADCSTGPLADQVVTTIRTVLPGKLDNLYTALRNRLGPDVQVFVMGYGNPAPDYGQPIGPNCPYLTSAEVNVTRRVQSNLNAQLRDAARRHGFTFVDPTSYFHMYDLCRTTNQGWWSPNPAVSQLSWFHPNELGYRQYAYSAVGLLLNR